MPDDPNVVTKSAVLQSITAEANGFYGVVVTVASTFLGGSLLFLEKFAPARSAWSIVMMALGWTALVASIGCITRIRFLNLRSGKLALQGDYDGATKIDHRTDMPSNWSQWLLIGGMSALVFVGVLNFNQLAKNEKTESVSNQNSGLGPLNKSVSCGNLTRNTAAPVSQTPPPLNKAGNEL